MKSKKTILDTNLWINYLITHKFDKLDDLIETGKIELLFSQELMEEFISVAKRPKFTKYFTDDDIRNTLRLFDTYGKLVKIKSNIIECRDYKDNFLLNLAVDGKADFLVTGDKDLIVIGEIRKTKIISISDLFEWSEQF